MQDRELPPLDLRRIPMNLRSSEYKLGDEFKPFHPSASHVPPEYRDGWNRCWLAAQIQFAHIRTDEREECAKLVPTSWLHYFLTGPDAVVGKPPFGCPDVECLLRAVASAIRSRK